MEKAEENCGRAPRDPVIVNLGSRSYAAEMKRLQ